MDVLGTKNVNKWLNILADWTLIFVDGWIDRMLNW